MSQPLTQPNKTARKTQTLVIGAGAAGLFCAWQAARLGCDVMVIDHANKAGKKILMSGGGKCNFTNLYVEPSHYLSQNPHFCKSALGRYPSWEFIALVETHGLAYEERKHGQLFCLKSSKDILFILMDGCVGCGVEISCGVDVRSIDTLDSQNSDSTGFLVTTSQGHIACDNLVVATGGLSIPTMGATGFGYEAATQFGHSLIPQQAGLVPFTFTDHIGALCKTLSGISLEVCASNQRASFTEAMLFTHRGLSGPVMLQLSNYWQVGESISINMLPTLDASSWLLSQKRARPNMLAQNLLGELLPKRLAGWFVDEFCSTQVQSAAGNTIAQIPDKALTMLGEQLNAWTIKPAGTEGYRTAEVTLGGVCVDEVSSKTMESKLQPNLYFVGEVLDVTGWLGGYNFQWAWASAYACAQTLSKRA